MFPDLSGLFKFLDISKELGTSKSFSKDVIQFCLTNNVWRHPFSTYAKFSEKLTFVTPKC